MNHKHQVHNLIILDESGSMNAIESTIIEGFNELVQSIKGIEKMFPEQEHFISLLSFNSLNRKLLHFVEPVDKLQTINGRLYQPEALTPLLDAMGFGISKLRMYLEGKVDYNVLVTILTDGEENASCEYSGLAIKKMVKELKLQNWTFTYIGTDHDVSKMAESLNIDNSMFFDKNVEGIKNMFQKESNSRIKFYSGISNGKLNSKDFYISE